RSPLLRPTLLLSVPALSSLLHTTHALVSLSSPIFSFLLRPPPISTLFPYTTLFRSQWHCCSRTPSDPTLSRRSKAVRRSSTRARSEEHTSELQSPDHLVCRLLLEKKKTRPDRRHLGELSTDTHAALAPEHQTDQTQF